MLFIELMKRLGALLRGWIFRRIFVAQPGKIGPGAYIRGLDSIRVGPGFRCGNQLWMEALSNYRGQHYAPTIRIGQGVSLSNNVHISCIHLIAVGDDVLVGSNVYIGDHDHGSYGHEPASHPNTPPSDRTLYSKGPVVIGDRVWIGDGVVICSGVEIGSGAVIGANSVVTRNVPENSIAAGAPASVIKIFSATRGWINPFRHTPMQ